jgi:hypothetical protein
MNQVRQDGIFEEIRQERERQDTKWGGPTHDDLHTLYVWREIIREQLNSHWLQHRERLIRIAAVAVAAVESENQIIERQLAALEQDGA